MSRSARLLDLLQALRRHRRPVTAATLAAETGVSLRTIYRDVATLVAQGVPVAGEAGLGYVLQPGCTIPPLMFDADEIDALILGLRLAARRGDPTLAMAAENALAKIVAMLPSALGDVAAKSGLLAPSPAADRSPHLAPIRQAIRAEERLRLAYADKRGCATIRTIWPLALGFFEGSEMVAAFCETRQAFRHFRLDRIVGLTPTGQRFGTRHGVLLAQWRLTEGLDGMF